MEILLLLDIIGAILFLLYLIVKGCYRLIKRLVMRISAKVKNTTKEPAHIAPEQQANIIVAKEAPTIVEAEPENETAIVTAEPEKEAAKIETAPEPVASPIPASEPAPQRPKLVKVYYDPFLKEKVITGCQPDDRRYYFAGDFNSFNIRGLWLNLEYKEGHHYCRVTFARKTVSIDPKKVIQLSMDDGSIVSLRCYTAPEKEQYRTDFSFCYARICEAEITRLAEQTIFHWRVINQDGVEVYKSDSSYADLFREFCRQYIETLDEIYPDRQPDVITQDTLGKSESCFVYLMEDTTNGFHKIGISNSPKYREHTLQSEKPSIELLCAKEYPSRDIAYAFEQALHTTYAAKRIRGEWFDLSPEEVEHIKQTLQ